MHTIFICKDELSARGTTLLPARRLKYVRTGSFLQVPTGFRCNGLPVGFYLYMRLRNA